MFWKRIQTIQSQRHLLFKCSSSLPSQQQLYFSPTTSTRQFHCRVNLLQATTPTIAQPHSQILTTTSPPISSTNNNVTVNITESCVQRIKRVNEQQSATNEPRKLRVVVSYGGCSGYKADFSFTTEIDEENDVIFEKDNSQVVIDKESLPFVNGSTIDWVESLGSSKFLTYNPNADANCSCGSSFNLDPSKIKL